MAPLHSFLLGDKGRHSWRKEDLGFVPAGPFQIGTRLPRVDQVLSATSGSSVVKAESYFRDL